MKKEAYLRQQIDREKFRKEKRIVNLMINRQTSKQTATITILYIFCVTQTKQHFNSKNIIFVQNLFRMSRWSVYF